MAKPDQEEHKPKPKKIKIQIDRVKYEVTEGELTGAELRRLPDPDIGPERDLFQVIPGEPDKKVNDTDVVELRDGKRFFTAPAHINPGRQ